MTVGASMRALKPRPSERTLGFCEGSLTGVHGRREEVAHRRRAPATGTGIATRTPQARDYPVGGIPRRALRTMIARGRVTCGGAWYALPRSAGVPWCGKGLPLAPHRLHPRSRDQPVPRKEIAGGAQTP